MAFKVKPFLLVCPKYQLHLLKTFSAPTSLCSLQIWKLWQTIWDKNYSCILVDILFQMFWIFFWKPSLIWNPISFSFKVCFEWSINLWVCQLMIYKTSLNSKCNKTMRKEFNFKTWNYDVLFQMFWNKT